MTFSLTKATFHFGSCCDKSSIKEDEDQDEPKWKVALVKEKVISARCQEFA